MIRGNRNQFIYLILRIMLISALIIVLDKCAGTVLKRFYFRQSSGAYYRTTYAIDSTKADILVFGSSRANHSYVPDIFEDSLSLSFYNTGKDGNYTLYNYAIFKAVTRRYNPKIIIFDIRPEHLAYNAFEYDRLSSLLPYCHEHPEIEEVIKLRSPFEKIKLMSAIYPYNSMIFRIAMGNMDINKLREPDDRGYVPIFKTMQPEKADTLEEDNFRIDDNKMEALSEIAATCKAKEIDLVFVYSPIWFIMKQNIHDTLINKFASRNSILYFDMSNDSIFMNNPDYFADKSHLNDKGARKFSASLAQKLKEVYQGI